MLQKVGTRSTLLVASLALLALACRSPTPPPPGASGRLIYELQLCANCHGEAGEGRWLGPPLRALVLHWDAGDLAEFFADPAAWSAGDERLSALAERYPRPMAPYAQLSREERLRLADHVLGL